VDYPSITANAARVQAERFAVEALAPSVTSSEIVLNSLTISSDAMPYNYVARAVILDLQAGQAARAIASRLRTIRTGGRAQAASRCTTTTGRA
jgi:hypothetical protein